MTSRVARPDTETMAERILMIDDDNRLAGMVSDYLGGAGLSGTIPPPGREGGGPLERGALPPGSLRLLLPRAARPPPFRRPRRPTPRAPPLPAPRGRSQETASHPDRARRRLRLRPGSGPVSRDARNIFRCRTTASP